MRAAEGLSDIGAVVAFPCGNGTGAPVATHHGAARQGEKSRSRMAFATRRAIVRAVGEDLDAWMGLGYYASRDFDHRVGHCGVLHVTAALRNTTIGLLRWAGYTNIAAACRRLAAQPVQALALIGIALEN